MPTTFERYYQAIEPELEIIKNEYMYKNMQLTANSVRLERSYRFRMTLEAVQHDVLPV